MVGGTVGTPKSDYVTYVRPLTYLNSTKHGQPCPRQQQQLLLSPPEFESLDCRPLTLIVQLYHRRHHNEYHCQQCKNHRKKSHLCGSSLTVAQVPNGHQTAEVQVWTTEQRKSGCVS